VRPDVRAVDRLGRAAAGPDACGADRPGGAARDALIAKVKLRRCLLEWVRFARLATVGERAQHVVPAATPAGQPGGAAMGPDATPADQPGIAAAGPEVRD